MKPDLAVLLKQHPFVIPNFQKTFIMNSRLSRQNKQGGKYIEPKFAHKYYATKLAIDFIACQILQTALKLGLLGKAKRFDGSYWHGDFFAKKSNLVR
jgi:hypothetical protein